MKLLSLDVNYKYSQVRIVNIDQLTNRIKLTPNPVREHATLQFPMEKNETVTIYVIDASGKRILSQQMISKPGINQVPLNNLNNLQPGVYVVQIVTASKSFNTKMTVQ